MAAARWSGTRSLWSLPQRWELLDQCPHAAVGRRNWPIGEGGHGLQPAQRPSGQDGVGGAELGERRAGARRPGSRALGPLQRPGPRDARAGCGRPAAASRGCRRSRPGRWRASSPARRRRGRRAAARRRPRRRVIERVDQPPVAPLAVAEPARHDEREQPLRPVARRRQRRDLEADLARRDRAAPASGTARPAPAPCAARAPRARRAGRRRRAPPRRRPAARGAPPPRPRRHRRPGSSRTRRRPGSGRGDGVGAEAGRDGGAAARRRRCAAPPARRRSPPAAGAAFARASAASAAGSESATTPPPTSSQAWPSTHSKVRIATLSSRPAAGLGEADRAAERLARGALQRADDVHRRELRRAGDRAGRKDRGDQRTVAYILAAAAADLADQVPHAGVRPDLRERGHRDRPRLADAPEVVAHQVDDHDVLGAVLRGAGQLGALRLGGDRVRRSRARALDRRGAHGVARPRDEQLRRQARHRAPRPGEPRAAIRAPAPRRRG